MSSAEAPPPTPAPPQPASAPPPVPNERLLRVTTTLIGRTEAGALSWEKAAPPDAWALTVATSRFRVRTVNGDENPPYTLEVFGSGAPQINVATGLHPSWDEVLVQLYRVARHSAESRLGDPLHEVERQLGI